MKIESLAARKNRRGQLLRLGGRENEHRVRRRLLERFQKRVERAGRQHMHLVDDIDLVFRQRRRIFDLFAQIADFVHAVVARRVDFNHVHAVFRLQRAADLAFAARIAILGVQAVDRAGEHLGSGRFAGAARAAEQIRVRDMTADDLPAQRARDRILPADFRKRARAPCAIQNLIAHKNPLRIYYKPFW